jgi:iron complex outermembrane receptor protein
VFLALVVNQKVPLAVDALAHLITGLSVCASKAGTVDTSYYQGGSSMRSRKLASLIVSSIFVFSLPTFGFGQATGTLKGTVSLETSGTPAHGASVTILQLKRSTETDEKGAYEFQNIPPGIYDVAARMDRVPDSVQRVQIAEGGATTADFQMRLRVVGEQVTVTATGGDEVNSIQPITTLTSGQIVEKNTQSLGDALQDELGVAKRAFGPGTSRPIIRGFDNERVLVLQDGDRIGTLGFQSGDHGEPIDLLNLEKLEVVRGPATLLYGSSAMACQRDYRSRVHDGPRASDGAGSTNNCRVGRGGLDWQKELACMG